MQYSQFHKPNGERSTDTNITHESPEAVPWLPLANSHYTLFDEEGTEPEKKEEKVKDFHLHSSSRRNTKMIDIY